jgi:ribosomal protein RSM22 (predicted rRNA methylase)
MNTLATVLTHLAQQPVCKNTGLKTAYEHLHQTYQHHRQGYSQPPTVDARAYALMRMPATHAIIQRVLQEYVTLGGNVPSQVTDWGTGTGAALWVMHELGWQTQITAIEHMPHMLEMAKTLAALHPDANFSKNILWHCDHNIVPADLVMMSYMLSEQPDQQWQQTLNQAWSATGDTLIVIEPGTPAAFDRLRAARLALINSGATIIAPCGHNNLCPMAAHDWCHFSERLPRLPWQRHAKQASLNYEDEAFCYLIAQRQAAMPLQSSRLVRPPQHHTGHINLDVCTPEGLRRHVMSKKRSNSLYREAKKARWGQIFKP